MLRPRSIAIVGASATRGTVGNTLVRQLLAPGFAGRIHLVNPKGGVIEGVTACRSLADLPEVPEHVVFALADTRMEEAFDAALAAGAKAATILSSLTVENDAEPPLRERILAKAQAAGMLICGANCMGFYNFLDRLHVCGFATRDTLRAGNIALVTHSGSIFGALIDCEERLDYSLAVSSGQELNVTLADYMDFALERPQTRVIGLFMETARDPAGFRAALAKAQARNIPVVALKVGRSAGSAALAVSHSGALVGDDGAYEAVFETYGVHRVQSVEELAFTLMMFAQPRALGPGGLVSIHDSGGERGLMIDLAQDAKVPFAELSPQTTVTMAETLDPGLPAVNPLDAWGTGHDYQRIFSTCLEAMVADPATALGAVVVDRAAGGAIPAEYAGLLTGGVARLGKPVFLVSNHQGSGASADAVALTRLGFPVIDSVPGFLKGARHLLDHRDRPTPVPVAPPAPAVVARWRARLADPAPLDEADGLAMLIDFGVGVVPHARVEGLGAVLKAGAALGYPLVLKTAMPGIEHKSDVGGVRLNLGDEAGLARAYDEMAARLGPRVVVARMVRGPAVELILGMVRDAQFGPVVTVGIGGIHAELLRDRVTVLPPVAAAAVPRLLARLRLNALLDGPRGTPPADRPALAQVVERFSVLAAALGDLVSAIDVNPVMVLPEGAVAVDALVLR